MQVQGGYAPKPGKLRLVSGEVVDANRVHASGDILIFSKDELRQGGMQPGPLGQLVTPMTIESRLVLIVQAKDGVLLPLARALEDSEDVIEGPWHDLGS